MNYLETEIKFYLSDIQTIRNRIIDLGAVYKGREFETNVRLENSAKTLLRKKSLLRLRRTSKTTLTFKAEPIEKDHRFKIFQELEVEVSDFCTMQDIFERLGFHPDQVYEKWRETYDFIGTELCLDTMPFGDFLEIEGQKSNIKQAAFQIGLDWNQRIVLNYLAIFDIIRQELNLTFNDVTFDNFKSIGVNLLDFEPLLTAQST